MDRAPCPGLQAVCGTQVIHSALEQWNPSLHTQVLRSFLFFWTLTLKFLSESRMDTRCKLCYIKVKSVSVYLATVVFSSYVGHSMVDVDTWIQLCIYPDTHCLHILCTEDPDKHRRMAFWSLKKTYCKFLFIVKRLCSTIFVSGIYSEWGHVASRSSSTFLGNKLSR